MTPAPEKTKKTWQEARTVKLLVLSPTQLETTALCVRKWWLEKVRRLPVPGIKAQVFGTVLHGVVERFLAADDLGRDRQTHKPVELYPKDWHIARNRFTGEPEGSVNPDEQDRIMRMFNVAVETGVIARRPGREIEREIHKTIIEPVQETTGTHIKITGFIDMCIPQDLEIQDHKTSKATKWFKSQAKLKKNVQMICYAKALLDEYGGNEFTLRHNQFCTDPENPVVRKTEVRITAEEINREWADIQALAQEMQDARANPAITDWHHLPEPRTGVNACNAYGGCAFKGICFGQESVQGYIDRLDRHPIQSTLQAPTISKEKSMTTFANRMAQLPGLNKFAPKGLNPPTTPQTATAPVTAPSAQTTSTAPPTVELPPWAKPDCRACGTSKAPGFSSSGDSCKVCDLYAQQNNKPQYHMHVVEPVGDGTFVWELMPQFAAMFNGTPAAGVSATPSGATPVAAQDKTVPQAPAAAEAPKRGRGRPRKDEAPAPAADGTPAADATAPQAKVGGFTLLVNCLAIGDSSKAKKAVKLHEILEEIYGSAESGLDTWKRRDYITACGPAAVQMCGGTNDLVICSGIGSAQSDLRTLFDAIRPHAGMEIHPDGLG